jgi:hypothetical protein
MAGKMKKLILHYQLSVFGFVKAFQEKFGIESILCYLAADAAEE